MAGEAVEGSRGAACSRDSAPRRRSPRRARCATGFASPRHGVPIALGTDAGVGAHGTNAREFRLMVEWGGFSPMQRSSPARQRGERCWAGKQGRHARGRKARRHRRRSRRPARTSRRRAGDVRDEGGRRLQRSCAYQIITDQHAGSGYGRDAWLPEGFPSLFQFFAT